MRSVPVLSLFFGGLLLAATPPEPKVCSIPLLQAGGNDKTEQMPNAQKPAGYDKLIGEMKPIDRMNVVAPAPACKTVPAVQPLPAATVRRKILPDGIVPESAAPVSPR